MDGNSATAPAEDFNVYYPEDYAEYGDMDEEEAAEIEAAAMEMGIGEEDEEAEDSETAGATAKPTDRSGGGRRSSFSHIVDMSVAKPTTGRKRAQTMETTDDESIGFSSEATDEALDVPGVAIMHVSPPRDLDFDPEVMLVEDLRQECKHRKIPSSGAKNTLVRRLRQAVMKDLSLPTRRLTADHVRRKRTSAKREPERHEFATDEEFVEAWTTWRNSRDHNNESVKRSRENAKMRRENNEKLCRERQRQNRELSIEINKLRDRVALLTRVFKAPTTLTPGEQRAVSELLHPFGGLSVEAVAHSA